MKIPEIKFRVIAMSGDGKEVLDAGVAIENLGVLHGTVFLRLKDNLIATQGAIEQVVRAMEKDCRKILPL